jgi:hypothetical protein
VLELLRLARLTSISTSVFRAGSGKPLRQIKNLLPVLAGANLPEYFYQFKTLKDRRRAERQPGRFEQFYNV